MAKVKNSDSKVIRETDRPLWEIWEWEDHPQKDGLLYENLRFEELENYVREEVQKTHQDVLEDTVPYEQYVREDFTDSRIGSPNCLCTFPKNERDAPDHFFLMKARNGDASFGLTAWRKTKHPDE